jgi:hypothetical protein
MLDRALPQMAQKLSLDCKTEPHSAHRASRRVRESLLSMMEGVCDSGSPESARRIAASRIQIPWPMSVIKTSANKRLIKK